MRSGTATILIATPGVLKDFVHLAGGKNSKVTLSMYPGVSGKLQSPVLLCLKAWKLLEVAGRVICVDKLFMGLTDARCVHWFAC